MVMIVLRPLNVVLALQLCGPACNAAIWWAGSVVLVGHMQPDQAKVGNKSILSKVPQ
jgi:hypothetical protein